MADDEEGRGFRLVAPGGNAESYPLTKHTRWIRADETASGMEEALGGLVPAGFLVERLGPFDFGAREWRIELPEGETFDGETLRVVRAGGGAVRLRGDNATVRCVLERRGSEGLGGHFSLSFGDRGEGVETTRSISHDADDEAVRAALEELDCVDEVIVNSESLDVNQTGSGAKEWHVTFAGLRNSGDLPTMEADYGATALTGAGAGVAVTETRKGSSLDVMTVDLDGDWDGFAFVYQGVEGHLFDDAETASPDEMASDLWSLGLESVTVERHGPGLYLLDIMGGSSWDGLSVRALRCQEDGGDGGVNETDFDEDGIEPPPKNDAGSVESARGTGCTSTTLNLTVHTPGTAAPLGGLFSLVFPMKERCNLCKQSTDFISPHATSAEVKEALERLYLVDKVDVVTTESPRPGEYKVEVQSGVVGACRNFYVRFDQSVLSLAAPAAVASQSTAYSGDLQELAVDARHLLGTPARDSARSADYSSAVVEVVKGTDLRNGGPVDVSVSINGGADYSGHRLEYLYTPLPVVRGVEPGVGSTVGGTEVRVTGDDFTRKSVRRCLFRSVGDDSMVETVDVSYIHDDAPALGRRREGGDISGVLCRAPPSLRPRIVYVSVIANENPQTLRGALLDMRSGKFEYRPHVEVASAVPSSATTAGNITVSVVGGPFRPDESLSCKFGDRSVAAVYVGPARIECIAPSHSAGSYPLEVGRNGQDYSSGGYVFRYYHVVRVSAIVPPSGPARQAGTSVRVVGENFVNSTSLRCRFGPIEVPATFVSGSEVTCSSPPIGSDELAPVQVQGYHPQNINGRLVGFEVSINGQDFTGSGLDFLYQEDIEFKYHSRSSGPRSGGTPVFIRGSNFVNTTNLSCRFGKSDVRGRYLTREAIVCVSPMLKTGDYLSTGAKVDIPLFLSNNGWDYTYGAVYTFALANPSGSYQPGTEAESTLLICPRGSYCTDQLAKNFTLCGPGTYQPLEGQDSCVRCPIGYFCGDFGLAVPRICPPGYICDERGMNRPKPCPTNHICERGTATFSTACPSMLSSGSEICFDNSTDDFGLQASIFPASVWSERHLMPLDEDSNILPTRGRFCRDYQCLELMDTDDFQVFDQSFDYSSTSFKLKRPRCVEGTYCDARIPPSSVSSRVCSKGHFCRFGKKYPCPVASYCPANNLFDPLPCPKGTFNFQIGQIECSKCPIGYHCPMLGLADPAICPPGYVCSKVGLENPNVRCPAGFYCQNGTKTSGES